MIYLFSQIFNVWCIYLHLEIWLFAFNFYSKYTGKYIIHGVFGFVMNQLGVEDHLESPKLPTLRRYVS